MNLNQNQMMKGLVLVSVRWVHSAHAALNWIESHYIALHLNSSEGRSLFWADLLIGQHMDG